MRSFEIKVFWIIVQCYVGPVPKSVKNLLEYLDLCNVGILLQTEGGGRVQFAWSLIEAEVKKRDQKLLEPCGIKRPTLTDRKVCERIYAALSNVGEKEFARIMQNCKVAAEIKATKSTKENIDDFTSLSHYYDIQAFWVIVESLVGPVPNRFKKLLQHFELCNIGIFALSPADMQSIETEVPKQIDDKSKAPNTEPFGLSDRILLRKIQNALTELKSAAFVTNMRICSEVMSSRKLLPTSNDSSDESSE